MMEHLKRMLFVCAVPLLLLAGCMKFGVAETQLTKCEVDENNVLTVEATILDGGGCKYFIEQGFCYSLFPEPSLTDIYSTSIITAENSDTTWFSQEINLPMADTAYYVRAFVKNNAVLSYSNQMKASTKQ